MIAILQLFGTLEATLLLVCGIWFIFCLFKVEGLEQLLPWWYAWKGTILLGILFLVAVLLHDHVNISMK